MDAWVIVSIAVGVGLLAVVLAIFLGGRMGDRRGGRPVWEVPPPQELRNVRFPIVWQGYDPAAVDEVLDAWFELYEELYFAAGPTAITHAREALVRRRGGTIPPGLPPAGPVPSAGLAPDAPAEHEPTSERARPRS